MIKPLVYLASPYAKGLQNKNLRAHLDMFHVLRSDGVVTPIAPLLSVFADLVHPDAEINWLEYDLELLARCDGLIWFDAVLEDYIQRESSGRDLEISFAKKRGIQVFDSVTALYKWALMWTQEPIVT
jgi:hypothetical protein